LFEKGEIVIYGKREKGIALFTEELTGQLLDYLLAMPATGLFAGIRKPARETKGSSDHWSGINGRRTTER
jgi:hypothetical protein